MAMDQQLKDWKLEVERLFTADAPDWHVIARLVAADCHRKREPDIAAGGDAGAAQPA